MIKKNKLVFLTLTTLIFSCSEKKITQLPYWEKAQTIYLGHITESIQYLDSLHGLTSEDIKAKEFFTKAREAFKKAEPYAAYLNPETGHRANGPALPIFKEDSGIILSPIGFQKIEESLFEGNGDEAQFKNEIALTKGLLQNLKNNLETKPLDAQRFFIASHQQLLRIISLGITGFDTPVSLLGISESAISLRNLEKAYTACLGDFITAIDPNLDTNFRNSVDRAVAFIEEHPDFNTFDRYTFIRDYFNPVMRNWVQIRKESGLWEGVDNKPFNFDAPTFFEPNSFNPTFFTPATNRNVTQAHIILGEKLFADPNLSQNGKMACTSCHNPQKAYADGNVVNKDNTGNPLERNTPTLINTIFQQNFFWDGRSPTLQDQVSSVFTNEKEFDVNVHQFSDEILKDTTYTTMFKNAFGERTLRNTDIIKAISSYVSTLNTFNSKFDKNLRGEEDSFTTEEKLGMNLFMGKALCATCHFMPLTNGTVPPFFTETEREVIGVPKTAENTEWDDDLGFYWMFKKEIHRGDV